MKLSPRQSEIAELLAKGMSDKAIAKETGLSVKTVQAHIERAAARIPGEGRRRWRLMVFAMGGDPSQAA